ncbi:MAG: hypothetical protein JW791_04935, partial [Nanoarchaeota archaeon]|nr:hypothetical protein [Nanoarchaeota archaeon]
MELRVLALTFIAVSLISLSWGIELIEPERLYWTNEDEFISSVVLNKEGVTYDLLLLEALNVNKTVIDFDEYFIYQSHYRSDIAVIISNNTAPYRGSLNIRVMPKLKVDSTVYLNIFLPEKRDFKKPALSYSFDEWETIVNYPYGANYTNNAELIITRLDERVIISITNPLSEMVTKTSVSILYELNPNESLTTQDRDSIYLIINEVLNLTGSEVNSLTALINSMPSDETITDEQ